MRWLATLTLGCFVFESPIQAQDRMRIELAHSSLVEARTKAQLQQLLDVYDLSKWILTHQVKIDETAIPHSHPILTLHTAI